MLLIKLKKNGDVSNLKKTDINVIINNKNIDKIHTWNYKDSQLVLYGCIEGKPGCENKYDLPPPLDNSLFFNDMYIIKYNNNKIVDLLLDEYNMFYEDCFGGFEDIDMSEDDEESTLSEHTSDREFIDDNTISDFSQDNSNNDITSSINSTFSNNNVIEDADSENNTESSDEEILLSSIELTITDISVDEDDVDTESEKND